MSVERRRQMVQADHASLSIVRQCALLSISRSGFYYEPAGEDAATLALMRAIDETYLKFPFYGSRRWRAILPDRVARLAAGVCAA
jgi:putative transposase